MQKLKFKIKGMHCHSCATLNEEELKELDGILKAKVDYDSQKAVVVYDEQKIQEKDIFQAVERAGNYRVEKIVEEIDEGEPLKEKSFQKNNYTDQLRSKESGSFPKSPFLLGFLASFSVISLIVNIFLFSAIFKSLPTKASQEEESNTNQVQNQPSNPSPSVQPSPTQQPTTPQTFTITKDNHVRGDFNAPITLVEFSDFECPFCERHYPTLNKILSDYKGKVRLVYKHFPLSFHPNAQKAAEASECADEQGKFWEYHDKLFENLTGGYSVDKFKQWAKDLGLDSQKFDSCLDSGKYAQKVQTDFQEGSNKGVNGTPATFVNGQLVSGAQPYESFKQVIDGLLQ